MQTAVVSIGAVQAATQKGVRWFRFRYVASSISISIANSCRAGDPACTFENAKPPLP